VRLPGWQDNLWTVDRREAAEAFLMRSILLLMLLCRLAVHPPTWRAAEEIFAPRAKLKVEAGEAPPSEATKKLRVVIVGAHPDDSESGCGGLIALLTQGGHEVIVAYATCFRGDRKIGTEPEVVVRRREATAACQLLGAKPHFFDYAHEKLVADDQTLATVDAWLKKVQPDIVVTHWPLDTHPNHHVIASLVWQPYLRQDKWSLYLFEVMTDQQTQNFHPELYLDIEGVRELKHQALACHKSQKPEAIWEVHEAMHRHRGTEAGVKDAEAYVRAAGKKKRPELPVSLRGRKD
jgi:LmbE family N-acetylglucosaminyl deacetylase